MDDGAALNTDRELWRDREGDFYADSIHVTADGGIGINVGGTVIVMPLCEWHALASGRTRVLSLHDDRELLLHLCDVVAQYSLETPNHFLSTKVRDRLIQQARDTLPEKQA